MKMDLLSNIKKKNVGENERKLSTLGGGAMLLMALARRSSRKLPMAIGGGYLLYRGLSGKCPLSRMLSMGQQDRETEGIDVERSVTIARPVEEIYSFWRNFENLPRFMQHLEKVEILNEKTSRWVARAPLGQQVEWRAEITEEQPNEKISWRSLPDSEVKTSGSVLFKTAPAGRGTEIRVYLTFQPPGGTLGAAIARLFGEHPDRQVREDLRRLKQILETGETATVTGQPSGRSW
ncbi:MAG: SRPBCC family protein [Syntrophotaleaceae bacterium]